MPQGTNFEITEFGILQNGNTENEAEDFIPIENGNYVYNTDITMGIVTIEVDENGEKKEVITQVNSVKDKKIISGTVGSENIALIRFHNQFRRYALPETGSDGTNPYTIAGAVVMLLGAGFLYRKKFRGRRVKNSR